jgi:outer membrane protein TolC
VAIAQYNKAVIGAVKEAADALSSVETNRADAARQAEVVDGLQKTVSLDRVRLESGLAARFDLLSSNERLLSARQAQVDLAADGALRRIQLLVALGGGFTPFPTAPPARNWPAPRKGKQP